MATNSELAQLSKAAYDPVNTQLPIGWELLYTSNPNSFDYQGYAFKNYLTGEIVIANRGTEPAASGDRLADWQMGVDQLPDQYQYARQFYFDVLAASKGAPITITGHSLGGSLTQLLAAETGLPAVTFNPYRTTKGVSIGLIPEPSQ